MSERVPPEGREEFVRRSDREGNAESARLNGSVSGTRRTRLALVVSHPIQYYAPLYQRLARREDLEIRVFFTWHAGETGVLDRGFGEHFAWDIPLTSGYEFEVVANSASSPGTHHFLGLRNPSLLERVTGWGPDVVHVTGWAWWSHVRLLRDLHRRKVPVLFRGDSHLLDSSRSGLRWWLKRLLLARIYSWPSVMLYVGQANRRYYEAFRVGEERLRYCPHSVDVGRFSNPSDDLEREAADWRRALEVPESANVLLFAGKFERKKQPLELMRAVLEQSGEKMVLIMVGGGELGPEVHRLAASDPGLFRLLPFQNQSRMPVVYRLCDLFVLPSAFGETWGLAVNEAMASGRPVLVSDRVGCGEDVVDDTCGEILPWRDMNRMIAAARRIVGDRERLRTISSGAARRAWSFDISLTESATAQAALSLGTQW